MKGLLKSAAGLALVLAWWTLTGNSVDPNDESADRIPTIVWAGGGGQLAIAVESTSAAQMRLSFSEEGDTGDERSFETYEDVGPGQHTWSIDVPHGVSGYVDHCAVDPKLGDALRWSLEVDGQRVDEQSETLDRPLERGYAFCLQAYFDDYAAGSLAND